MPLDDDSDGNVQRHGHLRLTSLSAPGMRESPHSRPTALQATLHPFEQPLNRDLATSCEARDSLQKSRHVRSVDLQRLPVEDFVGPTVFALPNA